MSLTINAWSFTFEQHFNRMKNYFFSLGLNVRTKKQVQKKWKDIKSEGTLETI